ncbi:MAG: serine protease [Nitrospirae bacterium]|nr:serine protease [Nitrospirota bacterium]
MNSLKILILLIALLFVPAHSFADAGSVFRENRKSIVVVTAYNKKGQPLTEGTGFFVNADGAVITNYHVIAIAKDIKVTAGGRVLNVEGITYADKENDIVILKVKGGDMPAVRPGDFEKINPGGKVYVISKTEDPGNIIHEGKFRKIRTTSAGRKVIEITATVSHGSSGSPVFNSDGEVIGIVTFLLKRTEKLILAMPLNLIRDKINSRKIVISTDRLIKDYRESADYWFYLGYFLSETGAHKEAIDVLSESIRLKPGFADAYYYLGIAYENSGKNKEAARAFKEAVKSKTDFADAHFSLGVTYGKLGMYREALEVLKQAVKIEPDFADAYYNIGIAYEKLGMYREGIEACRQAVSLNPDFPDAYYNLGIAYEKTGAYTEAEAAFQKVLKFRAGYPEAHYNLGIVYLLLRDKGSALERYKILKSIDTQLADRLLKLIYK